MHKYYYRKVFERIYIPINLLILSCKWYINKQFKDIDFILIWISLKKVIKQLDFIRYSNKMFFYIM